MVISLGVVYGIISVTAKNIAKEIMEVEDDNK